jgi:repressor LexA
MKLTDKQKNVLNVIQSFFLENGFAPSLGELQRMLNISTKRGVVGHLEALEKKGYIIRTSEPRGIHIVEGESDIDDDQTVYEYMVGIPLLGFANAGTPIVSAEEEDLGELQVHKNLIGSSKEVFSLIISGDSMNMAKVGDQKLSNGNYLIVQKDAEIRDGDIVVAIIEGSATVKRFEKGKDTVILYPESSNPIHQPIYLDHNSESLINGKVITVLEKPNS